MYDELKGVPQEELSDALKELLRKMLTEHRKVLFNGNGYTDEWVKEAESRGLDNLKSLPEAMPRWISEKSIKLFTKHGIFTKEETASRYEILLENYSKTIHIESLTLQEMVRKDFIQGLVAYMKDLAGEARRRKQHPSGCGLRAGAENCLHAGCGCRKDPGRPGEAGAGYKEGGGDGGPQESAAIYQEVRLPTWKRFAKMSTMRRL